ncbi:MAG: sortase [Candidatus Dormibacteraeota bacterium]|nr:sortase [Candidatus Dormibacteraeota bacterium]
MIGASGGHGGVAALSLRVSGPPAAPPATTDTALSTSSPPVWVTIPAIAVHSRLEGLHLKADGSLQAPRDPAQVGWYVDGPAPGDNGAAVFDGHLDTTTAPAVFWRLAGLLPGDRISVQRADGRRLTFVVDHSASYPHFNLPIAAVYGAAGPELHLITCEGTYDPYRGIYSQSLLVVAKLARDGSPPPPAVTPPSLPFRPLPTVGRPSSASASAGRSPVAAHPTPRPTPAPASAPPSQPAPTPVPSATPTPTPVVPVPTPPPPAPLQASSSRGP